MHVFPGRFPDVPELLGRWASTCDAVIAYSVVQYAFVDATSSASSTPFSNCYVRAVVPSLPIFRTHR